VDKFDPKQLLQEQLEAARPRAKFKAVQEPRRVGIEFSTELQRIVLEIRKEVNRQIMPLLRDLAPNYVTDAWSDTLIGALRALLARWQSPEFRAVAETLASRFVRAANQVNADRFNKSMGIDVFGDAPDLQDFVDLAIADNTRLITSIPDQYLRDIESAIMTNVRSGQRPSAIAKTLTQKFGVAQRRAEFIARDQTAKVNASLTQKRQTGAGFDFFRWIDSDDSRVRKRHSEIADKVTAYGKGIYRWDYPPLSDQGTPIIPGQDFNCRCIAQPVTRREVETNQKAGRVRVGVKR
jgi:SPP1 gp7 family putative phage head morphogenesis protein